MPGWNSSARITIAIAPAMKNSVKLSHRYRVPISLWLVVSTQRARKALIDAVGGCRAVAGCAGACMIEYSTSRINGQRLNDIASIVAPGIALIRNHRREIHVGELRRPGLHLGVGLAVHHTVQMI